MAQKQSQTSLNSELYVLRAELNSVSRSTNESIQQSGADLPDLKDQVTQLTNQMRELEESQNTATEEMKSLQNTFEMDAKIQLIVEVS